MPLLFSYGTLQNTKVQLETFNRILEGSPDDLIGYKLDYLEITDPEVLRKSNQQFHPILRYTGFENDRIPGVLFEVSEAELLKADDYEVDDYKRIETGFASGKCGFIYVEK